MRPLPSGRLAAATSVTFVFTETIETWIVPAGVTSLTIEARGAEGGNGGSAFGPGRGAIITGTVSVTPGQSLSILVGGTPVTGDNNGGGGTFVIAAGNTPLLIAGGGGGSGEINDPEQKHGQAGPRGGRGASGGAGGVDGQGGKSGSGIGAGGGLYTNGGGSGTTGGRAFVNGGVGGVNGAGGFGGGGYGSGMADAGGGGGYSGGGADHGVGGGGGSFNSGTNPSSLTGVAGQIGNGLVVISYELAQPIRYVKPNGTGDGSSWANASGDLQAMINEAGVEQVWVATGRYQPALNTSFAMKEGVAIYGGFRGTEEVREDRPSVNPVSGGPSSSTLAGNGRSVIASTGGQTNSAQLNGFIITGGNTDFGGGISISNSSPTVINCLLQANTANYGGGMSVRNNSSPNISNCILKGNTAILGGGLFNITNSNLSLTNCVLQDNSANRSGGAVFAEASRSTITNCTLSQNRATGIGAALFNQGNGQAIFTNTILWDNQEASNQAIGIASGSVTANYCVIGEGETTFSGTGNIVATRSPFVSDTDLRLIDCSQAINAGNPASTSATSGATDLAGQPRFYPTGGRIDIGAYEYQASPTVTTVTIPSANTATVGVSFSQSFSASGGQGTYSYSVVSGSLPEGLSLSQGGLLSGVPTQTGSYSIIVQAQAEQGCTGLSSPYRLTVSNPTPTITDFGASPSPVCAGSPVTFTATVGNYSGGYSYTLTNGESAPLSGSSTSGAFSQSLTASGSASQSYTLLVSSQGTQATATTGLSVNPTLSVSLNNNGQLSCERTSVRLAVPSVGNNATYVFSGPFPVSQPTGTSSRTATVSQPGEYTVLVTNAQGCTATATTLVEANTDPPRNLSLTVSNIITCAQPTAVLDASANNNPGFVITGPGGQSYSANTATVSQPGEYTLTATRNNGCSATRTVTVETNTTAPENVSLTNNGPLSCSQTSVNLSASSSTTGVAYGITGPEGYSASGGMTSVNRPGTYTLTATGTNGCTAVQTTTVESNTTAPENVSLVNTGPLTCAKTSVQLNASSTTSGALSYSFTGANPITQDGSAQATVSNGGSYTVTVTGANGCSTMATTEVGISLAGPTVSLTNNGPVSFTNTSVTLTATEGAGYSYNFSSNAAQQGSSNKASVTTAGVYSVTVTRQDNGCSTIASTTVTGGNNPTVCRGGTAVINVIVEGDPVKYEWYKNSLTSPKIMETPQLFRGTATSSLTLINAQTNTQGNFFLKVTDRSGQVKVYGPYRLTVDASCRAREVAQLETPLHVELAPNPIQQDRLRAIVRGAEGRSLQVDLIDLSGKPIRQQRWTQAEPQQRFDWDMQGQASGLYLLQVVSEAGAGLPAQRQSVKVIKP
ncbi:hypothetical protein GCM10027341_17270 [Spirosoma knui]